MYWIGSPPWRRRSHRASVRAAPVSNGSPPRSTSPVRSRWSRQPRRISASPRPCSTPAWTSCRAAPSSASRTVMRRAPRAPSCLDHAQLLGDVGGDHAFDELVDAALHHVVDLIKRQPDAMIGDPTLGKIVRANLGGAVAGRDLLL